MPGQHPKRRDVLRIKTPGNDALPKDRLPGLQSRLDLFGKVLPVFATESCHELSIARDDQALLLRLAQAVLHVGPLYFNGFHDTSQCRYRNSLVLISAHTRSFVA